VYFARVPTTAAAMSEPAFTATAQALPISIPALLLEAKELYSAGLCFVKGSVLQCCSLSNSICLLCDTRCFAVNNGDLEQQDRAAACNRCTACLIALQLAIAQEGIFSANERLEVGTRLHHR
jgi:hypothetical protein